MADKIKKLIYKYGITTVIGLFFTFTTLYLNDYWLMTEKVEKYRILTDAFSIPGVILIMVGGLVFVSTDGFFDMISYSLGRLRNSLVPFSKKSNESYYDYKTRKSGQRFKGYSFLFFDGIAFLIAAAVFMILFFSVYK